jgi:hypothetical protein
MDVEDVEGTWYVNAITPAAYLPTAVLRDDVGTRQAAALIAAEPGQKSSFPCFTSALSRCACV